MHASAWIAQGLGKARPVTGRRAESAAVIARAVRARACRRSRARTVGPRRRAGGPRSSRRRRAGAPQLCAIASKTGCTSVGELADDAQDLGRRRLLLQRLLGLVEEAHVLDRDHRLVGEGLRRARSAWRKAPPSARRHSAISRSPRRRAAAARRARCGSRAIARSRKRAIARDRPWHVGDVRRLRVEDARRRRCRRRPDRMAVQDSCR